MEFKQMRKQKRLTSIEGAKNLLEMGECGFLATVCDGQEVYPYVVPLNYVFVESDNAIYFHCAHEGKKIDNIIKNNRVCFCVVGRAEVIQSKFTSSFESTIVFGRAEFIEEPHEKGKVLLAIIKKYCPDFVEKGIKYINNSKDETCIVKIQIEHITGKSHE